MTKEDPNVKTKLRLNIIAILLLIIGATLTAIGAYHLGFSSMHFFSLSFDEHSYYTTVGMGCLAPGMFMVMPGLFLLCVANQRKIARYGYEEAGMALSEASGTAVDGYGRVISKGSEAMVKGMRDAGGLKIDVNTNKEQIIKIKCQACGTLNDENAKYCDQCGAAI